MYKLYTYQKEAIAWLSSRSKAFLALDQGLGKTCVSCTDAIAPALVICPATLKINWAREFALWRPELKVQVIGSAKDQIDPSFDVHVINYDIVHKVALPSYKTLICDESHYLKSMDAKRTKFCSKLVKSTERVRLLSGTPVVNRPIELYPMLRAIGATKLDYINFGRRYCAGWQTPWGSFDVSGASNLEELYTRMKDVMYRVTKETALPELPAKTYRIIEFDLALSSAEKKLLKELIAAPKHKVPFEAIPDILKLNSLRKLPLVIEHIKNVLQHENKVVVFGWHSDIITALYEALNDIYGCVKVVGGVSQSKRQEAVDEFQKGEARVFLGNIRAAGVGLTLTAANYVIFAETTWTPAELHQAADRCHRIGQTNHVQVDILTIERSIDAMQLHSILDKTGIINQVVKEETMKVSKDRLLEIAAELQALTEELQNMGVGAEPKDEPKAEPKAEPVKAKAKAEPKAEPVKEKLKLDDVRRIARESITKANGESGHVVAALSTFCVDRLSELNPNDYEAFIAKLGA